MGKSECCHALETHVLDLWCASWCGLTLGLWVCAISWGGIVTVDMLALLIAVLICGMVAGGVGFLVVACHTVAFGGTGSTLICSQSRSDVFHQAPMACRFDGAGLCSKIISSVSRARRPWQVPCHWVFALFLVFGARIGEARVPGPVSMEDQEVIEWSLGTCNPSGLVNKASLFSQSNVDVWCVAETHLSKQGQRLFMQQLRVEESAYKWCVSGWPAPLRSSASFHGSWTGVSVISKHPTRSLPDSWPCEVAQSSRIVAATSFVHNMWVSGVTVYGVPIGPTHPKARAATVQLVEAAIDRLQAMEGPRYLAGDFNHDVDNIPVLQRLEAMHFVEVQDVWHMRSGVAPMATCKGRTRRDLLYVSHELAALLVGVKVDSFKWADHAEVIATFRGTSEAIRRYPWPLPRPLPWQLVKSQHEGPCFQFEQPADCTETYKQFWQTVEARVADDLSHHGQVLSSQCFGRAQRLERHVVVGSPAPPRKGRDGEFQPRFFGLSFLYAQWLKQLRRLQSYSRLCGVSASSWAHIEHRLFLWNSIIRAPGFAPNFVSWWQTRVLVVGDPESVPLEPPGVCCANAILSAMQLEVRNLEARLNRSRRRRVAKQRSSGLTHLYASVRRDAPVPVDVLVESRQSTVDVVDHADSALELRTPTAFVADRPVVCNGRQLSIIVAAEDKLYVDNVSECQPGDTVCQTVCTGHLDLVFKAFTDQWRARWDKHAGLVHTHWDSLFAFAVAKLGRVQADGPSFAPQVLRAVATGKKAKAAVGLDGVSRWDILNLVPSELQSIITCFVVLMTPVIGPSSCYKARLNP